MLILLAKNVVKLRFLSLKQAIMQIIALLSLLILTQSYQFLMLLKILCTIIRLAFVSLFLFLLLPLYPFSTYCFIFSISSNIFFFPSHSGCMDCFLFNVSIMVANCIEQSTSQYHSCSFIVSGT